MRALILSVSEADRSARDRWRDLATHAAEPNPFFEPEFVVPAAAALGGDPALLVATGDEGEWTGLVPVVRGRGWRGVPLRGWSAWRHDYSYLGTPLVRPRQEAAVIEAWLRGATSIRPFLGLDLLDADGPFYAALAAPAGPGALIYERHERAALRRAADGLEMRLSSKRRRENARLGRRMGEALGEEIATVDRSEDAAAVDEFLRLEAAGWKGEQGTALASNPAHAEMFTRVCRGFSELGRLQFLSLEAGGRALSMKCDILAGGTIYCFKTCFDESLAEFSPGVQLERALADHEKDNPRVDLIDTCAEPGNEMANRVWPDRRRMASVAISSPKLGGALSKLTIRATARARKTIRRTP